MQKSQPLVTILRCREKDAGKAGTLRKTMMLAGKPTKVAEVAKQREVGVLVSPFPIFLYPGNLSHWPSCLETQDGWPGKLHPWETKESRIME